MVLREAARLGTAHAFGVGPGDPASFAAAAAVLALVVIAAGAGPAWRAARVDPVVAIRAE